MLKRTILLAVSLLVVAGCDQVESSSRQLLDATAKSAKQAIDDTHQAANKALDDAKQELSVLDIKPAQIEDKRDQ